jgi:phage anti-repressor protein
VKELIEIKDENGKQTVSARELHQKLGVKTSFKDWIKRMIDYGFEEKKDFCSFLSESSGGRPLREYAISIDMAKEICMIQRSEIGRKFRQYFIECEENLKNIATPIIQQVQDSPLEKARFLHELAIDYSDNATYKQILDAYATKEISGEFILPLPELEEKNYSATEVGEKLGISANRVGKIANILGLKVNGEFGKWYVDKARNTNKQVNTFRYTQKAIEKIKSEMEKVNG